MKARIQRRQPHHYDEQHWKAYRKSNTTTPSPEKVAPANWAKDSEHPNCNICEVGFTLFNRRHHCRRCGKLVCKECAPEANTRPIMEWGMRDPVRHCKDCYRSPAIAWKDSKK